MGSPMNSPTRAAIAGSSAPTVEAGARIAREGGNAVDVAVAAALTATASEILQCSLGGSGFVMLHLPGRPPELIEGADAMPGIDRSQPRTEPNWRRVHVPYGEGLEFMAGHGAVAVPGILAALERAWQRHGSLPWAEILAPVIELTRTGWPMSAASSAWLEICGEDVFGQQPDSRTSFFPDGRYAQAGETIRIPGLSETMELIAREGARAFYEGDIAAAFAREMAEHGGHVTRADLSAYRAQVREPLSLESAGFTMAFNPPPAVGGAALGSLIGLMGLARAGDATQPGQQALACARAQKYIQGLRERDLSGATIDDAGARALLRADVLREHHDALSSPHTTHLSVATADGGIVAITMSLGYGAGVTIPGTGIACNNSAGEFELNPGGFFALPPGHRFVSNMAPTVAWHPDGRCIAMGSPGASRITTAIAQTWQRFAQDGASFAEAVAAPRLHVEKRPDGYRVQCEPGVDVSLLGPEFTVHQFAKQHLYFGGTHVAGRDRQGVLHAIADERRDGKTAIA